LTQTAHLDFQAGGFSSPAHYNYLLKPRAVRDHQEITMGATIFTRQHIEVLSLADGNEAFVLWEEHYENNVYPHNPHWSCTGFGRRPEALRTILRVGRDSQKIRHIPPKRLIYKGNLGAVSRSLSQNQ
jgi:hypothetical protein